MLIVVFAVLPFCAAMQHWTSDTDVAEGREGVGQRQDMTLHCFDQCRQNLSDIDGGLGWDHVSGSSAARGG